MFPLAAMLFLLLALSVSAQRQTWTQIFGCDNTGGKYLYSFTAIQQAAQSATQVLITFPSGGYAVSNVNSYPITQLRSLQTISFSSSGYATPAIVSSAWTYSGTTTNLLDKLWNSCGAASSISSNNGMLFWSCNNGNGLHLSPSYCYWTASAGYTAPIQVFINVPSTSLDAANSSHVGCFFDCGSSPLPSRDLPIMALANSVVNTPSVCVRACAAAGYQYAAVQYSSYCFCGNTFGQISGVTTTSSTNTANVGGGGVYGGTWTDQIGWSTTATTVAACSDFCLANPACMSAALRPTGPGCAIFPYKCAQSSSSCPVWGNDGSTAYYIEVKFPTPPLCNMPCSGDGTQNCGGACSNSVYKTGVVSTAPKYLGCFGDGGTRDLPFFASGSSPVMTPSLCALLCTQKNFQYAGVQYAVECWCGNSFGMYGTSSNCNMQCSGDATKNCGGGSANAVYQLF